MTDLPISAQITFLYTRDLESTALFYEEVMGLHLALDQGACRIYQVSQDGYLGFCQREDLDKAHPGLIFTLVTSQVDQWHQRLLEQGVFFENPPNYNPRYKIYHCFFRDPNGYLLEIQRFEDPAWQG
jgi:catechol 2,3-dioxygenase-like lactoylglutathione lyase family enzyme